MRSGQDTTTSLQPLLMPDLTLTCYSSSCSSELARLLPCHTGGETARRALRDALHCSTEKLVHFIYCNGKM